MKAKEADLVILDEPTSALDVEAEHQFFQQLKSLRRGKTHHAQVCYNGYSGLHSFYAGRENCRDRNSLGVNG